MFSEFYVLSAILVWVMPLMAIAGSILRKDLLPATTWKVHILLGIIFATFVSYINLHDRDLDLVPTGRDYLACDLISRNEPQLSTFRTVTLNCEGEEKKVKEEFYDLAVKAARRHE
ncbi:TPA: hypothetical protein ACTZGK_004105 [Raoultella planticola]|uniref:hypothetical protein n=1 Tax=Klebsiella grimontii TaxID=2058152 RepID=UPI0012B6B1A2|nr:hypothetical protein [Klebsiella grimontii]